MAKKIPGGGPDISIVFEGGDIFVVLAGVRIAKRGYSDTPQAGAWISLEPGFAVFSSPDHKITVEKDGVRLQ